MAKLLSRLALGLFALSAAAAPAAAQSDYPRRQISMIVPFAAGGPTDIVARVMAQSMGKPLGQSVIVENRPSNGGILAPEQLTKASPDGYTILIHHIGMSTAPFLYRTLRYKPMEDFEYIGLINEVPMTIIARGNFPADNFKDFLTYIKANKTKVTYANAGLGAASHLCGMLFMSAIQTDFLTVPYKGTGPAMNDLLGGQVDFMCDQTTSTTSHIKSGKVKVFAVTTPQRVASLKEVPTLEELGIKNADVAVWHAFYAPKGTPKPVIDRLVGALQVSLKDPVVATRFAELGTEPVDPKRATPDVLRGFLKAELAKWGPLIQKAGQYAD
jgi:tripartite-type tricarboxylate transporter receptor subunit TctC